MGRRKKEDFGCLVFIVILGIVLMPFVWLAENCPTLLVFLLVLPFVIYFIRKIVAAKKRAQKLQQYKHQVEQCIAKWQEWEKNGVPSVQNDSLTLDKNETLLYAEPYLLKVGAGNRLHKGMLYLTNSRLLFLADTTVKEILYEKILALNISQNALHIIQGGKEKMLHITPRTADERDWRLKLADAYAVWFLLNRGPYEALEGNVFRILGVRKEKKV